MKQNIVRIFLSVMICLPMALAAQPGCSSVRNLQATSSYRTIGLNWDIPDTGDVATTYQVEYIALSDTHWNSFLTTEHYFFISGLTPNTGYDFRVTALCSDSVGTPVHVTAYTLGCTATAIDSTGVNSNLPIAYSNPYSYTQQIFPSAELTGIDTITSLTFFLATNHNIDTTPLTLYLGNVTRNQFASDSDFVPLTQMTQVFAGTVYNTGREVNIHFDTPFIKMADSNIVIAIDNDLNDSATSIPSFVVGNGTNRSIYRTSPDDIIPTSPGVGTRSNQINRVRFGTTGCTLPACDIPIVCVDGMGFGYIDITWNADSSAVYTCSYRPTDASAPWTIADDTITSSTYHLNNLIPGTSYEIRVTCICGSDTLTESTATYLPCFPVSLPYTEDFGYFNFGDTFSRPCWKSGTLSSSQTGQYPIIDNAIGYPGRWCVISDCYLVMPRASLPLNRLQIQFDLIQIITNDNYLIMGVLNDIDDTITSVTPIDTFSNRGRHSFLCRLNTLDTLDGHLVFYAPGQQYQYLSNIVLDAIPNCAPVELCNIDSVTTTSAVATWLSSAGLQHASAYMVEYGPRYFTPGTGTQLIVFDTAATLTGLSSGSDYDLYIYSICGNDTTSYYGPVQFSTQCEIFTTLPYIMDFEGLINPPTSYSAPLPTCWYSDPYNPNTIKITYSTNSRYVSSGVSCLENDRTAVIALPQFSENINNLKVSFHLYRSNARRTPLMIGTVDSVTPGFSASFTPIDTLPYANNGECRIVEFYLTDYTGTANRIALFLCESYIDDLIVDTISTSECIAPAHARLTARDTSSATITWRTSQAPAYRIEYGIHGFTPGTGDTITTNTRSITLTGLLSATTYDAYVTALCDTTQSTSDPITFRTTVGQPPASIPYQCSFADSTENRAWELVNGNQTNQWHIGSAIYDGSINDHLSLYISNDNGTTNAYTCTQSSEVYARRSLHLTHTTYHIHYGWRSRGVPNWDFLRVFLIPSTVELTPGLNPGGNTYSSPFYSTTPEGWIPLDGGEGISYTRFQYFWWRYKDFDFEIPETGEYDLMFYWTNDNSTEYQPPAAVDNILITLTGCPATENLSLSNTTSTSVTLQWDADTLNLAQKYLIEYGTTGFTPGTGNVDTATGTSHTVTGLAPNTAYDFYVTTLCDEIWYADSIASLLNIYTLDTIFYTVTLQSNNDEYGIVLGSGTYPEGHVVTFLALPFEGYRFDTWDDDNTTNPRLYTVMNDITLTAIFVPNTGIDTIAHSNINTLTLYPNPTSGTVTVTYYRPATITIIDINGREMLRQKLTNTTTTLDISQLAPGNYFVRIVDEPRHPIRKLVIK